MSFVEKASLIAKNGFMFFGDPGLDEPSDWETADLPTAALGNGGDTWKGWEFIGASSLDDLPEPGNDGGDTDVKGSWDGLLNRQILKSASIDYLKINPLQFDKNIMSMYWGDGTYDKDKKKFTVNQVGATPVEKSFLLLVADGPARIGIHAFKASFTRDDKFKMSHEDFTEWPIRVTWLQMAGKPGLFDLLGVADDAAAAA